MIKSVNYLLKALAVALLVFAPLAFADVSMTLTGVGSGNHLGGVYIGPYDAMIGSQSVQVICDDFATHTSLYSPWTAKVTDGVQILSGTTLKWAGLTDAQQLYDKAAWLSLQLLDPNVTCSGAVNCKGDIQFAIWEIFTPGAASTLSAQSLTNDYNGVLDWLGKADAWYKAEIAKGYTATDIAARFSNFSVYTPVTSGAAQEFLLVRADEAPAPAVLALNLFALLGLVVFLRRRQVHAAR